jgi:hypothetical protein
MQRRILSLLVGIAFVGVLAATGAWAGNPHIVQSIEISRVGDSLCVSGKEAGLGDESQIVIVLTGTAECINGGGNHPKAVNKESISHEQNVPVQNGKAEYSFCVTATFTPSCNPPMTIEYVDITVTDTTNNISSSFPGPF